ncbi:MAG: hypothetical protein U5R06_10655 [candidate division KSB1 bacterium]|nr:hypothetical protein [candidate division KSB1 bacterium]
MNNEKIRVGAITNHNKFAQKEYKTLMQQARKQEICLLPGVELSVGEGNGIHTLIVFHPEPWLSQHDDFINRFLDEAYPNSPRQDRENNNARASWNFNQLLDKLQEHKISKRDSFVILAHVDQPNGFCKELNAGRQKELVKNPLFREFVLGIQKCTSHQSRENINNWFDSHVPAFVQGSDNKDIDSIGKCRGENGKRLKSYIKIGDFSYHAVKYALMDQQRNTEAEKKPGAQNAYITSLALQTKKDAPLAGQQMFFNSSMNNLIGIRGSGKSTILELVRYALNKKFDQSAKDTDYKEQLVEHALGSGGKIILNLQDKHGTPYRIERVLGEKPVIFRDHDVRLPQFSVDESLLSVLYFGQKDLSEVGSTGFSQTLMEKFFGAQVGPIREKIAYKSKQVLQILDQQKNLKSDTERKQDYLEEKNVLKEKLRIFKEKQVDKKLNRQVQFKKDRVKINEMIDSAKAFQKDLFDFVDNYKNIFTDYLEYQSQENDDVFIKVKKTLTEINNKLEIIIGLAEAVTPDLDSLKSFLNNIDTKIEQLQNEFAEIKRSIDQPELNPDDYIQSSSRMSILENKLTEIEKIEKKYKSLKNSLDLSLDELNELWHSEYQTLQKSVDQLNAKTHSIKVELEYKGDKKNFKEFLSSIIKGSNVTNKNIESIIQNYNDCIAIYKDIVSNESKLEDLLTDSQLHKFKDAFMQNLRDLLVYQVPNLYILKYRGKNIAEHSLGQRASALIVFLLTRQENDLIIIDQPEDDIDNQSIYQDVIRELNALKDKTQFIFATHNPNIPVLGECEQLFCCQYENEKINIKAGSIDRPDIQQSVIEIMEGGREAFEQRKRKYSEWKH